MSNLLAYLEGEPDDDGIDFMAEVLERLLEIPGDHLVSRPVFVNEGEGLEYTVGILLRLPPPSDDLDLERLALNDVEDLIGELERSTPGTDHVVAFELDGEVVGWVEDGARDLLLREGLVGPWRERVFGTG